MKLTIEHLAPYLPYGLKLQGQTHKEIFTLKSLKSTGVECEETSYWDDIYDFKPILRPLFDLTKEIEHDEESFVPVEMIFGTKKEDRSIQVVDHLYKFKEGLIHRQHIQYWIILLLFEWHFDVFNLIENNLAIDINNL